MTPRRNRGRERRRFEPAIALYPDELRELRESTTPIAGRPGWRIDANGRQWYSAAWLEPKQDVGG